MTYIYSTLLSVFTLPIVIVYDDYGMSKVYSTDYPLYKFIVNRILLPQSVLPFNSSDFSICSISISLNSLSLAALLFDLYS